MKCPVCNKSHGYRCLLDFFIERIRSLLANPEMYLFFFKNSVKSRSSLEGKQCLKINKKRSKLTDIKENVLEHCHYYDEELVFLKWLENSNEFLEGHNIQISGKENNLKYRLIYLPEREPREKDIVFLSSCLNQSYEYWDLNILYDEHFASHWYHWYQQNKDTRIKISEYNSNAFRGVLFDSQMDKKAIVYYAVIKSPVRFVRNAFLILSYYISKQVAEPFAVYSDHADRTKQKSLPVFKPDWNHFLFLSNYYLGEVVFFRNIYRNKHIFGGASIKNFNYHQILKIVNDSEYKDTISHLPLVLYDSLDKHNIDHEEMIPFLSSFVNSSNVKAKITYNEGVDSLQYQFSPDENPLVSIIIPTRNNYHCLKNCMESIILKTTYENFEIFVVNNNSDDLRTLDYFHKLEEEFDIMHVLSYEKPFNFSAINNFAAAKARGELLCFLNDDTEVISPAWLTEMVANSMRPGVGVVGAKLYYPDDTIQHAGVVLGLGGIVGHINRHLPKESMRHFQNTHLINEYLALTAACMLIRKDLFLSIGGFNEIDYKVAYNDVDLCLRVYRKGFKNILVPAAELYHHEKISRGDDRNRKNRKRYLAESEKLLQDYGAFINHDPYYNPNLTIQREDSRLICRTRFCI